ncbi:hypothetical protein DND90_31530 [Pseudomonas syringae pv. maculicola]|nr:hypothetical protein DND90_31530 [Pseudomonas syringae pv. maculicola]
MHIFQINDSDSPRIGAMTVKGESPISVNLELITPVMASERLEILQLTQASLMSARDLAEWR